MKNIVAIILLIVAMPVLANDVCPVHIAGKNEPPELIINESDITAAAALAAIKALSRITDHPESELDGTPLYIDTANAEMTIKGYILLSECKAKNDKKICKEFCRFISEHTWYD